jgi:hypothetical protein
MCQRSALWSHSTWIPVAISWIPSLPRWLRRVPSPQRYSTRCSILMSESRPPLCTHCRRRASRAQSDASPPHVDSIVPQGAPIVLRMFVIIVDAVFRGSLFASELLCSRRQRVHRRLPLTLEARLALLVLQHHNRLLDGASPPRAACPVAIAVHLSNKSPSFPKRGRVVLVPTHPGRCLSVNSRWCCMRMRMLSHHPAVLNVGMLGTVSSS